MQLRILANSPFFERHIASVLDSEFSAPIHRDVVGLIKACKKQRCVVLVHARSREEVLEHELRELAALSFATVGVAADCPRLEEMLRLSRHGIRGYFNSYMAAPHYTQLVRLLATGQTWFHPDLLGRALQLAQRSVGHTVDTDLAILTAREKEIALDVAQGMSNKRIATGRSISERTVKTHLTRIFKKLHVSDRTTLAVRISNDG